MAGRADPPVRGRPPGRPSAGRDEGVSRADQGVRRTKANDKLTCLPVSQTNSRIVYDALKSCGIGLMSALPETWLVHLIRMAEDDPAMTLVRLAKEEEGIGISAGAHLAGAKSAMLMQNHGFLQSVNGIVSLARLYRIP